MLSADDMIVLYIPRKSSLSAVTFSSRIDSVVVMTTMLVSLSFTPIILKKIISLCVWYIAVVVTFIAINLKQQ